MSKSNKRSQLDYPFSLQKYRATKKEKCNSRSSTNSKFSNNLLALIFTNILDIIANIRFNSKGDLYYENFNDIYKIHFVEKYYNNPTGESKLYRSKISMNFP